MAQLRKQPKKKEEKPSLLQRFNSFIGNQINSLRNPSPQPGKVRPIDVAREIVQAPKIVANKIVKEVYDKPNFFNERAGAVARSIQLRSTQPIKESFNQQFSKISENNKTTKGTIDNALNFSPMGIGRVTSKIVPKTGAIETVKNFFRPTESVIARQGEAGKELKTVLTKGIDKGELQAGKRVAEITKAKLSSLSKPEKQNLLDVLEGRAKPISTKVDDAFKITRVQTDELASYAKESGVTVKRKVTLDPTQEIPTGVTSLQRQKLLEGKPVKARLNVPFEPKSNFYPHSIPNIDNLKGSLKKDIAENIVRQGIKPNMEVANQFIDDYANFIETGGKQESLINFMVETGQSKSAAEAFSNLQRYRNRTIKRSGSLEFSRDIDLPFYDPDPSRVLPKFVAEEAARLEQIRAFGQGNEKVNKLILDIRDNGGDADTVRVAVDRALNLINDANTPGMKASRFLRTLQGFKLGLAAIPNMTQGVLNSLLAADLRAVVAGLKGVITKSGRTFALKTGATLDSVLQESAKETGALTKFLKATGFTATERMNRTLAANAGASYGNRLIKTILKNPNKKNTRRLLEEFGIEVDDLIKRGKPNEDDILMFAKKFTDITQFRSRPLDLPLFASSPSGKVFFQFKNFIYGQTRLLHRELLGELKNKQFGRAARNLIILATVFPLAGEAVADIRSLITGRKREEKGLDRYLNNIGQTGALGILMQAVESGSYGRGVEFISGPTVGDAGSFLDAVGSDDKARNIGKFFTKKIPIVGNRVTDAVFPPKNKKKETKPTRTLRRKLK